MLSYSCAQSDQREQKAKVSKPDVKARATRRMPRFPCDGWLHIKTVPQSNMMEITVQHKETHPGYIDRDIPDHWKEYIRKNAGNQTPGQVILYNFAFRVYKHSPVYNHRSGATSFSRSKRSVVLKTSISTSGRKRSTTTGT